MDEKERQESRPDQEQAALGGEETVGEILLSARDKSGLTLEAVSQETKIPVATLQYLETDNFEAIPASVYAKGFLRTYARQLGLDTAQLINKYEIQTGQSHTSRGDLWEIEEEVVEEELDSPHIFRRFVLPAVLVIVAVFILWKVLGGGDESSNLPPDLPGSVNDAAAPQTEGKSGDNPVEADALPQEGRKDEAGRQETESAGGADQVKESAGGRPPDTAGAASGEMTLRISAEERIWFDLVIYSRTETGLDSTATDFILEPGDTKTFTSNEYFYIKKIGKTGGFSILLDGEPVEIPVVEGRLPRNVRISRSR